METFLGSIDWFAVISVVLTFGLGFLKSKMDKIVQGLDKINVLLGKIKDGAKDGKLSTDEIKAIAEAGQDLINVFK